MFNLFCTLPALPAAKPQPIPLRCMKVPPLPVTPNRAVVYARTADRHVGVLETQYNSVLAAAREDGCIVVDAAIEHRPGSSLRKPGLLRLLKVIRKGEANVLYVQDLSRLHSSPFWLYLLFCWMQDHNAKSLPRPVTFAIPYIMTCTLSKNSLSVQPERGGMCHGSFE